MRTKGNTDAMKTMRVRKWFWAWHMDKEKTFLEEMSLEGYRLVHVSLGTYTFEKSQPRKLTYQMDYRGFGGKISEEEYLQIYEDTGWDLVSRFGGWYYFCQEWKEGIDSAIFNDNESKGRIYKRLLGALFITGFPLYYQTIFIFPNMSDRRFEFPNFFFFVHVLLALITVLHILAVVKIVSLYRKTRSGIHE